MNSTEHAEVVRRRAEARDALQYALSEVYAGAGWEEADAIIDKLSDLNHAVVGITDSTGASA